MDTVLELFQRPRVDGALNSVGSDMSRRPTQPSLDFANDAIKTLWWLQAAHFVALLRLAEIDSLVVHVWRLIPDAFSLV